MGADGGLIGVWACWVWCGVVCSKEMKELVTSLLHKDPSMRPSVTAVLKSPYLQAFITMQISYTIQRGERRAPAAADDSTRKACSRREVLDPADASSGPRGWRGWLLSALRCGWCGDGGARHAATGRRRGRRPERLAARPTEAAAATAAAGSSLAGAAAGADLQGGREACSGVDRPSRQAAVLMLVVCLSVCLCGAQRSPPGQQQGGGGAWPASPLLQSPSPEQARVSERQQTQPHTPLSRKTSRRGGRLTSPLPVGGRAWDMCGIPVYQQQQQQMQVRPQHHHYSPQQQYQQYQYQQQQAEAAAARDRLWAEKERQLVQQQKEAHDAAAKREFLARQDQARANRMRAEGDLYGDAACSPVQQQHQQQQYGAWTWQTDAVS